MTAGYLSIANSSPKDLTLISASSPAFERIELHTMSMEGEIMKMQQVKQIITPPGAMLELQPQGNHLMMFGIKKELKSGDTIQVTLNFKQARSMTLPLIVKKDY